ncbi:hypothetical protein AB6D20_020155 [Vibrio splendidus]|nr:hypothetical protein A148_23225 [Vibrio splendidus 1F-157]
MLATKNVLDGSGLMLTKLGRKLEKYSELVKPMKAMIEENHKSNIELAKLRDRLLPKLLSGEIELGKE